ncbi:PLP-dependent aminotransferase family protein [Serratia sp. L9]|uniref:MocR-like pyridoxine biosynthesis transcription factor PdxR n=1 Tax=Serratia sp. L9 TaxID=3423946 RepID=UPI003D6660A2
MLKEHRTNVLLHGDPQGAEPLRKAIAAYLNLERGAKVYPEQILVLSSTRQSLFLCAQLLVDAGKPILLENPGYFGARKAFESAEARIVPIDVDEQGIRMALLRADRSGANCLYVTPSHQYPTGATLPLERRLELINWAAENGKWIIEDDYDSEFHYEGLPTACVQGLDKYQRTLYLGTFSKTLYPGLRIGYMALPHELVKAFTYARSIMDGHTPQILQLTLARFMEDGHYNSHVRAMRKLYAGRRAVLLRALGQHLGDVVTALRPEGGLQIPCLLAEGWSEEKTIRQAEAAGVQLAGLSRLYAGEQKRAGWILGYASLTDYEIETAVQRLASVLKR